MAPSRGIPRVDEQPPDDENLARIPTTTLQGNNPAITPSQSRIGPTVSRVPSIRIARLPSANRLQSQVRDNENRNQLQQSTSRNQRPLTTLGIPGSDLNRERTTGSIMAPVPEDGGESTIPSYPVASAAPAVGNERSELPIVEPGRIRGLRFTPRRNTSNRLRESAPPGSFGGGRGLRSSRQYDSSAVDLLDVIDPEVSTLSTLTNVQNSLFVPNLGRLVNRRPEYRLSPVDSTTSDSSSETLPPVTSLPTESSAEAVEEATEGQLSTDTSRRRFSISSQVDDEHYAVLPHLFSVDDWPEEDVKLLNDHVRHQLHSRRAKFKRQMKGFGKYASRPLGFAVTLYATLITIFGLVWVLFLIGWLSSGERTPYIQHIVDSVLVALFAIVGDGMIPWRAVDTYHMAFIANYHLKTLRLRREKALPRLPDDNDLPTTLPPSEKKISKSSDPGDPNIPSSVAGDDEDDDEPPDPSTFTSQERPDLVLLKPEQQKKLEYHQAKFAKSHSFYKPHETSTHYAFPLKMLIIAVVLLDMHSVLQVMLGSFTWGWSYHTRPSWITTVILCCSITVNITAGIVISIGDRMTRKKDVIERMFRQQLTEQGIKKLRKKKRKAYAQERKGKMETVRFQHGEHPHRHHHGRFSLDLPRRHDSDATSRHGSLATNGSEGAGGMVKEKERGRFSLDLKRHAHIAEEGEHGVGFERHKTG